MQVNDFMHFTMRPFWGLPKGRAFKYFGSFLWFSLLTSSEWTPRYSRLPQVIKHHRAAKPTISAGGTWKTSNIRNSMTVLINKSSNSASKWNGFFYQTFTPCPLDDLYEDDTDCLDTDCFLGKSNKGILSSWVFIQDKVHTLFTLYSNHRMSMLESQNVESDL